jgi:Cft2 family RNA processing exonuclease
MQIEFYGATSGITGSCHILRANGETVLVDDLSRWLGSFRKGSPHVHVVYGEPESKKDLRDLIESNMGLKASVPDIGDVLQL